MNMKKLLIIWIFAAFASISTFATTKSVAVYVEGDVTDAQEQIISSAIAARMTQYRNYEIFERNEAFINALNKEHDFQLSGEVKISQIRAVGNKLGVDYVVGIVVTQEYNHSYMTAKLMNLITGKTIKVITMDRVGNDTKTLQNLANNVIFRLLNQ